MTMHVLHDRRGFISQAYRLMHRRWALVISVVFLVGGWSLASFAATGDARAVAVAAGVPADAVSHIEFVLWFGAAILVISGVSGVAVKVFVDPAVDRKFAAHRMEADPHPAYLKQTDYTTRHDNLIASINDVGRQVADLGGQLSVGSARLRQDIGKDRRDDRQGSHEKDRKEDLAEDRTKGR